MNWLKTRLKEPSTYAGVAAILAGAGQLVEQPELAGAANVVQAAGHAVATSGGDMATALGAIIAGIIAVLMRDKGGQGK